MRTNILLKNIKERIIMVNVIDVNNEKGIYVVECERPQALEVLSYLRSIYPNALMDSVGYRTGKWEIHLHKDWDKYLTQKETADGKKYNCINCRRCLNDDGQPSLRKNGRCFGEEFWSEVLEESERHFVESDGCVLYYTFGEGGFGNQRYTIKLENGEILENVGLWHCGSLPKNLEGVIQKGERL